MVKHTGQELAVELGLTEADLTDPAVIAEYNRRDIQSNTEFWRTVYGDAYLFPGEKEKDEI